MAEARMRRRSFYTEGKNLAHSDISGRVCCASSFRSSRIPRQSVVSFSSAKPTPPARSKLEANISCSPACSRSHKVTNGLLGCIVRTGAGLTDVTETLEHDVEAVINVLQPGPLGIIEHKFSAEEVRKAKATAEQAIKNWKMNASLENKNHFIKHAANQSSEKDNKPMV